MTLLYLVAAWAMGIILAANSFTSVTPWLVIAVAAFGLAYVLRQNRTQRLMLLCGALFALGVARYAWVMRALPDSHIAHSVGLDYVSLAGVISNAPDVREHHVNLHVRVESLETGHETSHVSGLVLVQAPYASYRYGDRVAVHGQLITPPEYDDFSYRDYLARRDIYAMMPDAAVEVIGHGGGTWWRRALYALKDRTHDAINAILPSPEAPLLSGILLGIETEISRDVRDAFNATGTSHIIAISGANIIIVFRAVLGLLRPITSKKRSATVAIGIVVLYTAFVGADPAVVRAAIMGSLSVLAVQLGRRAYGLTTLAFAVWLMSVRNPQVLWDIGFQLSVAATIGVVLFTGPLENLLESGLSRLFTGDLSARLLRWLDEPLVVGLAAQIMTMPLIVYYFGRFSVVSVVANILIVPVQAYIMIIGWLAVMGYLLIEPVGQLLAYVVWVPLSYTLTVVRKLGALQWASYNTQVALSSIQLVYLTLMGTGFVLFQHPEDRRILLQKLRRRVTPLALTTLLAVFAFLIWQMVLTLPDGQLKVAFLDVGHGHSVLIQSPQGAQILVDTGPNPTRLRRALGDLLPFGDRDLDVLFITQMKSARTGALAAVLENYAVGKVVAGCFGDMQDNQLLADALQPYDLEPVWLASGSQLVTDDGVTITAVGLEPTTDAVEGGYHAWVLRVEYGAASFLITSDFSTEAYQALVADGWYWGSTVLDLPAAGSAKVNTEDFLRLVNPQVAVVTVGAGNRANLPAPDVVTAVEQHTGQQLLRTDKDGMVIFTTDGQQLWFSGSH